MRIAIISDIHNNEVNLKKVLGYLKREKIQIIICCGDLASQETLDFLNDNFSGMIHYTFGNMDNDQFGRYLMSSGKTSNVFEYKNTKIYKDFGELTVGIQSLQSQVAFVHFPDRAKQLCATGKYDFVFYGHTHKPWEETLGDCKMLNPGNVAGDIFPPTFAVWETTNNNFQLIRIHDIK